MAWYEDIDHVTVCGSIPKDLLPDMNLRKGNLTRSKYIRRLIEADIALLGVEIVPKRDSESAA